MERGKALEECGTALSDLRRSLRIVEAPSGFEPEIEILRTEEAASGNRS